MAGGRGYVIIERLLGERTGQQEVRPNTPKVTIEAELHARLP